MDSDGPSPVSLTITTASWEAALGDPEEVCQRVIAAALARLAPAGWRARAEVSVLLTDDQAVRRLNAAYRGQDRPTNVLSFPGFDLGRARLPTTPPGGPVLLGDLVLALETMRAEAEAEGKPLADHVGHLLVHGCLHLLGYDHDRATAAAMMEALETEILAGLGIADPYHHGGSITAASMPVAGRP